MGNYLQALPGSVSQYPPLYIYMMLFLLKQCITSRCHLVEENFSFGIWYCKALKNIVAKYRTFTDVQVFGKQFHVRLYKIQTSQNCCKDVDQDIAKLPDLALPLRLIIVRIP